MTNLNTAANAAPSVLVAQYVPTTGAAQYTAPVGTTTQITSAFITNTDTVDQTVTLSIVKSGGSAGGSNRVLPTITLTAAAPTVDLGEMFLGDGDFIWASAGAASKVSIVLTGIEFSNATGAVLSGIQDDAVGTGGRTSGSSTVTGTNTIGAANNRRLYASLMATAHSTPPSYTAYDTLTLGCTAGAMTRLVSRDFNVGGILCGSVHIFEYINPTSSSTQTLIGTVVESGIAFDLTLETFSLSGVASVTGATSSGPTSAAALSLPMTSAAGHRAIIAAAFANTPMDFACSPTTRRVRGFNGNPATAGTVPHWLLFGDAPGAATNTFTTSDSQAHCAVGLDLVPA